MPLRRVQYFDASARARLIAPGENPLADLLKAKAFEVTGPMRYRSPPGEDVLAWRTRIMAKYRGQLGENLAWDENSDFNVTEDAATSGDMLLRYVAAKLDQLGPDAAHVLIHAQTPVQSDLDGTFLVAKRRGFTGQFPQLLLDASYWLPFKRNLIIEEPDWFGNVVRYGSASALAEELVTVRAFISNADPAVTSRSAPPTEVSDNMLAAAWQASDIISRLCRVAIAQRLPLWTTA